MTFNEANTTSAVSWNLSQQLIFELNNLLVLADKRYLSGNISGWFFHLKAVKMRITQSLNNDERKILEGFEKQIIVFENLKPTPENRTLLVTLIEKYNEQLMDFLEKYGYLIQKKKDSTKMF